MASQKGHHPHRNAEISRRGVTTGGHRVGASRPSGGARSSPHPPEVRLDPALLERALVAPTQTKKNGRTTARGHVSPHRRRVWQDRIAVDPTPTDGAKSFLRLLARHSNDAGKAVWGCQERQARLLGRSERTVRRYRQEAEVAGYIRTCAPAIAPGRQRRFSFLQRRRWRGGASLLPMTHLRPTGAPKRWEAGLGEAPAPQRR
jgi:hypothetical protein